ncbi:hypothetical protein LP316_00920 [Thalassotalea sp. LPB0316]|uniref:hypothetical protein n=1 Tax=Thalassotalea sp. LPB0316 TaxID=2769490 RepID=UPI001865A9DA|nr:hypothetical protein [Thalassotalea sp. LPB0316]QOL25912.1 hypothetical protein LP316_00920 [Thalassotalea sp. LPB0316]
MATAFLSCALSTSFSVSAREALPIPEPMVFDLVRGLGAKQGEFEINTLGEFALNNTSDRDVEWAPEVEIAVVDGLAVEFELPFEGRKLEAYKFAVQYTFENPLFGDASNYIDGWQFIAEEFRHEDLTEWTALYLSGFVYDKNYSAMMMTGARYSTGDDAEQSLEAIINYTLFYQVNDRMTLGLENDLAWHDRDKWSLLIMPQVHYELSDKFGVQFGVGAEFNDHKTNYTMGLRIVVEPGH